MPGPRRFPMVQDPDARYASLVLLGVSAARSPDSQQPEHQVRRDEGQGSWGDQVWKWTRLWAGGVHDERAEAGRAQHPSCLLLNSESCFRDTVPPPLHCLDIWTLGSIQRGHSYHRIALYRWTIHYLLTWHPFVWILDQIMFHHDVWENKMFHCWVETSPLLFSALANSHLTRKVHIFCHNHWLTFIQSLWHLLEWLTNNSGHM